MTDKKYRVLNPRRIQKGVPILSFRPEEGISADWYEGNEFVKPELQAQRTVDSWIRDGYLREI